LGLRDAVTVGVAVGVLMDCEAVSAFDSETVCDVDAGIVDDSVERLAVLFVIEGVRDSA
jgi:hypothetical protein